ncbi:MAG: hypothetical protein RMJ15_04140 [Nitrososphaerota archaeon]|nr:hypothetical protein [Candidatus Bathyarchaeota archaeon]MDW8022913.1 hypothetical protein [Nitrososphaerota archaeon]
MTKEAKETLSQGAQAGSKITLDEIRTVAETPAELQKLAASAAVDAERIVGVEFIKSTVEQFIHPEEAEEEEGEEEEKEEETMREVEPKVKQFKNYVIGGRAYEVVSFVQITKPGTYAIYFDMDNRKVGIKEHNVDFNVYTDKFTGPKLYKSTFKCKHGTTYALEFDASDGTYKIEEVKEVK